MLKNLPHSFIEQVREEFSPDVAQTLIKAGADILRNAADQMEMEVTGINELDLIKRNITELETKRNLLLAESTNLGDDEGCCNE